MSAAQLFSKVSTDTQYKHMNMQCTYHGNLTLFDLPSWSSSLQENSVGLIAKFSPQFSSLYSMQIWRGEAWDYSSFTLPSILMNGIDAALQMFITKETKVWRTVTEIYGISRASPISQLGRQHLRDREQYIVMDGASSEATFVISGLYHKDQSWDHYCSWFA